MKESSIIIADDHPLLLKGLHDFLVEKKFNVIDSASDGNAAYNLILKHKPTIAILDIQMPRLSGLEVASKCKQSGLDTKVILITLHREKDLFYQAKDLNVFGYVLKEFAIEEIENCLASVLNNTPYFSPKITEFLNIKENSDDALASLTPSEKKILKLIAQDKTNKEIAEFLFISVRTVEKHRSNIIAKLDLNPKTNSLLIWAKDHQNSLL
ncbi:response regulator [Leptobacterium flavescens]|uniref:Response regulator n=1 Tax=Leptobacterium flavescens TaxID=472055 RepID=A0A6P0UHM8_9FLAO|nr:response regulator transcription factor [Leptobacterium flavescens]NER12744.1 response regulator [Leptobacterium flavescens]